MDSKIQSTTHDVVMYPYSLIYHITGKISTDVHYSVYTDFMDSIGLDYITTNGHGEYTYEIINIKKYTLAKLRHGI